MFAATVGLVSPVSTNTGSSSLSSGPATAGFLQVAGGTGTRRSHGTSSGIGSNAAPPGGSNYILATFSGQKWHGAGLV